MKARFTAQFFAANRARLRQAVGGGLMVFAANGLIQRGGDSTYSFHQDANFWYLTGINEPDVTLVMDDASEYLLVPERQAARVAFDGAVDAAELSRVSGISQVFEEKAGWQRLKQQLNRDRRLSTVLPLPSYVRRHGFYANPARARLLRRLKAVCPGLAVGDAGVNLVGLRALKQPAELATIQAAIDLTIKAVQDVSQGLAAGGYAYEYEIEASLTRTFRASGISSGHAFEPIVASGKRACTLHNVSNQGRLNRSELLILDVGAEVDHYAADLTRTFAVGGASASSPSLRQVAVYEAVKAVQDYALSLLKPGVMLADYERQVGQLMGERLALLGLIKPAAPAAEIRRYYPHATSHFLGLDVHDVGLYRQPLRAGHVLTVEPGIYIRAEAIGVRLEDDVLITGDGCRRLSHRLPRILS